MAPYLATVQVGQFHRVALGRNTVAWLPPRTQVGDLDKQQAMLDYFETVFGPYPFEDYQVVVHEDRLEIPLEAQGLSIFGVNHLRHNERLIAHMAEQKSTPSTSHKVDSAAPFPELDDDPGVMGGGRT